MFEFTKSIADKVSSQLGETKKNMLLEAERYENSAKEKESKAIENETKAIENEIEASKIDLNPQRLVEETEYDPETNSYTKTGENYEPDVAQAEANKALYDSLLAEATELRKEAADLRKDAANLAGLAASLRFSAGDLERALKDLQLAIEISVKAVTQTTNLLNDGISMLRSTIFLFNLPNMADIGKWISDMGSNILKIANFDDFSTKIQEGLKWLYETGKKTGAEIVSNFQSNLKDLLKINNGFSETVGNLYSGLVALGVFGKEAQLNYFRENIMEGCEKYLDELGISKEEKEKFLSELGANMQNIKILPEKEFVKYFGKGALAVYNDVDNTAYVRGGLIPVLQMVVAHEEAGHSMGTFVPNDARFEEDMDGFSVSKYDSYDESTCRFVDGFNEVTTQYFARRISPGKKVTNKEGTELYFSEVCCDYRDRCKFFRKSYKINDR